MNAEIITIGDELLIGQVVDTNSAWLGQQLTLNGIRVRQKTAVSDNPAHIVEAITAAAKQADIILITGGLGPTKDDLTKHTLAAHFGMKMRLDEDVLQHVIALFRRFGREITETNRTQAEVPDGCEVVPNPNGTAPGMWFDRDGKIYVSMPGVPYEMKAMFSDSVLPKLRERFSLPAIYHRTVMTQGIGESWLSDALEQWEASLKEINIGLAYLPSPGMVRLRLTTYGDNLKELQSKVDEKIAELPALIGKYMFAVEDTTLERVIGKLLTERKQSFVTAESCTGGYIAHLITSIPGSSQYFLGSTVTYANEAKSSLLDIPQELIHANGAVSEQVVKAMAKNVREKLGADYAISTSGIAGPSGGSEEKPVGTIWIAIASKNGVEVQ
jgi:nicotinamide-nucleotide amidase